MADMYKENSILIVEDHPLVAYATGQVLSNFDATLNITISNTAQDAIEEYSKIKNWFRIFLDIDVPGAHGLSLVRKFAQFGVAKSCVVVTAFDNPQWRAEVVSMGMLGYIVKATKLEDFVFSIGEVMAGHRAFTITSKSEEAVVRLTRRQQEILCLLYKGHCSKGIANQLGLAKGTVDNYVFGLLNALGAKSRAQAIARGLELGYINFSNISLNMYQLERESAGR